MRNELNYPVKYAVLELKERGGWAADYQDVNQGFIVSKCYVIESSIKYDYYGKPTEFNKVVFPYDDISTFKIALKNGGHRVGKRNIPAYDACGNPHPIRIVDKLFDTYEEAKEEACLKNEEYKNNLINNVSTLEPHWTYQYELLKQDYESRLSLSILFETLITNETTDMEVTRDKENVKVLKP